MPLAVNRIPIDAVRQIHQEIVAFGTLKTARMPDHVAESGGAYHHLLGRHGTFAAHARAARGRLLRHADVQGDLVTAGNEILETEKTFRCVEALFDNLPRN